MPLSIYNKQNICFCHRPEDKIMVEKELKHKHLFGGNTRNAALVAQLIYQGYLD